MGKMIGRITFKAVVTALIGSLLVIVLHFPILVPIIFGIIWVLYDEIGRID